MGHVKRDIHEKDRKYTVTYALNSGAGVKSLLTGRQRIHVARFTGDTAASDVLIDLTNAILNAGLTDRETLAVAAYSGWELTYTELGRVLDVTRQTATEILNGAADKIAAVYKRWDYGSVSVEYEEVEMAEEEVA